MDDISLVQIAGVCAGLGLFSHVAFFVRGEHLKTVHYIVTAALLTPVVSVTVLSRHVGLPVEDAYRLTAVGYGSYLAALFSSMTVYRYLFHPLRRFPGPVWAPFAQFMFALRVREKCDSFRLLHRLHAKYGDYVRVGPNLLSVADPEFVEPVHNAQTKFVKAEWYDTGYPMTTLHQMRDVDLHQKRRRHGWDKAFTTKSLRAYDSRVLKYTDQLVDQIKRSGGKPMNATEWLMWYAFDVMGDLAFGRSFRAVEQGKSHFYIDTMHHTGEAAGFLSSLPWAVQALSMLPKSLDPMHKLSVYSDECVRDRQTRKPEEPDVMSHILDAGPFFHDTEKDRLLLGGDSRLLIVAGSDTTATTLVYAFYHIAHDLGVADKLRAELAEAGVRNDHESFSVVGLQGLAYLNGIINETLRMHPPVPGGVFRMTPPEGTVIQGRKVPGGVKIIGPHFTVQRSPKAFVSPDEFIPERWTTQPELVLNKNGWFPFSIGKFSCIGKQLALNELRSVICKLVLEFDIALAPGETGHALLNESKEAFTMNNSKLDLCFTPRH